MPDGFQELARAAAGNVVMAMGTEAWPTMRATLLDVLGRSGDPAPETWVDTFSGMIAGAEGREQNGLRDAAFARIESAFTGILAQRPDAAGEIARLVVPASPGQSGPGGPGIAGAPGAAQPLDFAKDTPPAPPAPQPGSQPGAYSAPQSSPQSAPQGFPPPTPPQGMPPVPPGPPPSYGGSQPSGSPMGGPAGGPYPPQGPYPQDQFQPGNVPQGNYQQGNFQQGQFPQGGHQGPPPPMGHAGPGQHRNRPNSNKMIIGSVVAVAVVAGGIFGIIALTGDSDDDCPTAAGAAHAAPVAGALAVGSDKCGGPGGPGGSGGSGNGGNSTGGDAKNTDTVTGPWTGTYSNEVPAKLSGDFSITLEQDGNRITGDLDLDVAGCDLSGPVTGTMNGSKITLRSSGSSDTISMRGDLLGGRLSGKYTTTCNNASGSWKAEQG